MEKVQFQLEQTLPELKDLEELGLFSKVSQRYRLRAVLIFNPPDPFLRSSASSSALSSPVLLSPSLLRSLNFVKSPFDERNMRPD